MKHLDKLLKFRFPFFVLAFFLLTHNSFGQTPETWQQVAQRSTNFYEIKAAFLKENAARLAAWEQDMEDLRQGRISEITKGKYPGIKQFMRMAEWYEPRVKESNGDLQVMGQKDVEARLSAMNSPEAVNAANWTLLGPASIPTNTGNGRVNNIRIDPTNPNILYACTPASQLFKSSDAGVTWASISNGIPAIGVTDLAIDPTNTNILYALTGDGDQAIYHPYSAGLYKSTNGGASWNPTGLTYVQGNYVGLTCIIIHPTSPNTILVGGTNGIRRSTDGGATFTQTSTQSTQNLVFKSGDPNIVFAGSKYNGVLLRSVDNGTTWTQITAGLPVAGAAVKFVVDVSPVNTNYVYAMATNSSHDMQGFYRSTDGGLTFTLMATTPNIGGGQGWYDFAVCADPVNADIVYGCGVDVFKSINGGATWTNLTNVYTGGTTGVHPDMHDLTFSGSTLYLANDGGIYRTTNAGVNWTNISSNLTISQPYAIGLSATNPNTIIMGTQDNGTILTNNLTTWRLTRGGDGMIGFIDRTNNNNMYSSYQNGGLGRSTNGGASWSNALTGITGTGYWVTPYMQDPVSPATIYCGTNAVFKSTNGAANWAPISPSFGSVRWLDVDRNNTQIIYAMTNATIQKTTNGGATWAPAATGIPTGVTLLHIHIDVNNSNILYLSAGSWYGNNLYRSTDAGASWSNWGTGLPGVPANTVLTVKGSPGEVYCGTDIGVYYRNTAAAGWTSFNTNLPPVPVRDLEIFYPTGALRAGTFGRGVWETQLEVPVCGFTGGIAYVNASAVGTNKGTSWANAFTDLKTAVTTINASPCNVTQVWVAAGTYKPTTTVNRDISFSMVNGVTIYGGFPNTGNPILAQRNATNNITILSGDIGTAGNADNSYHVISNATGINNTAVLDGFVIANGNANTAGSFRNQGGGMFNSAGALDICSPKIDNCIFINNTATDVGGAVFNNGFNGTCSPVFTNCIFQNNTALNGAVLYSDGRSAGVASPLFTNCSFSNNTATTDGSVVYNFCTGGTCVASFTNCVFWGNGGVKTFFNNTGSVSAKNSLFEPLVANYTNVAGNLTTSSSPFVLASDLHLKDHSLAIDAGTATGAPLQDIDAVVRTAVPDMGAYENKQSCLGVNKIYYSDSIGSAYQWQVFNGTSFVNISNGASYTNVTTSKLTVIAPANTTTGTRFRCSVTTPGGTVNSSEITLRFYNRWLGTAGNDNWISIANWSCGTIPDQYTDVIVPSAKAFYPITNVSGTIRKLQAENGSSITVKTGSSLIIVGRD